MSDDPNRSEELDDDAIPEEFPPEQPYGVNERLTAEEEQVGESLEDRIRRERPDNLGEDVGRVGTLVAPGGEGTGDDEPDEVAEEITPQARRDQLDPDDAAYGDSTLRDVTQEKEGVIPAEEAAMHLTDEPPMGDGDGYLDE
jgi:hypothetical protein